MNLLLNYQNYFRPQLKVYHLLILSLSILFSCKSFHLSQTDKKYLQNNKKVGIHGFQVQIETQETLGARLSRGVVQLVFPDSKDGKPDKEKLKDLAMDTILKNFLDKGFYPVEREQLRQILKEYSLRQAGVIDDLKELKLSGIDSIFTAHLQIRIVSSFWKTKAILSFSGRLMDIKTGMILASGSISKEFEEIREKNITSMIDSWFSDMYNVRE
ncbi:MAG: hypothetical protein H7A25_05130 [Leptospiraceae bacterium]|nr:hypothetical protein [Leptospiraceae bacterium]MCP5499262.1 hypothetical protein [Leptospiraceae bacterium]